MRWIKGRGWQIWKFWGEPRSAEQRDHLQRLLAWFQPQRATNKRYQWGIWVTQLESSNLLDCVPTTLEVCMRLSDIHIMINKYIHAIAPSYRNTFLLDCVGSWRSIKNSSCFNFHSKKLLKVLQHEKCFYCKKKRKFLPTTHSLPTRPNSLLLNPDTPPLRTEL